MGDEFTPEELVILGETPEPKPEDQAPPADAQPPEGEKPPVEGEQPPAEGEKPPEQPEHTDEEKAAAEKLGLRIEGGFIVDEDGTKIPAKRWKTLYRQAKDTERSAAETTRKLNLFKELGPDKFYELYPEEAPATYQKPAPREEAPEDLAAIGSMVVKGGPYNGQTLNEVFAIDPAYANSLLLKHREEQRKTVETAERQREQAKQESLTEVAQFSDTRATEMFGKKYADLTTADQAKVDAVTSEVLEWMKQTRRPHYPVDDAYFLMNRENLIRTAHEKGGKAALESLKKPGIASVDTTGGKSVAPTDYESMAGDQLMAEIDKWPEAKYLEFLKKAPAAVRAKHPSLPWD